MADRQMVPRSPGECLRRDEGVDVEHAQTDAFDFNDNRTVFNLVIAADARHFAKDVNFSDIRSQVKILEAA